MKIATYNIWNSSRGMPYRIQHIIQTIRFVNADIIGLQEVTKEVWDSILTELSPKYYCFFIYEGDNEGLAFISKYPIENCVFLNKQKEFKSDALYILVCANGKKISFVNFHLTWNSALNRETEIQNIERFMKCENDKSDQQFILGDMNCSIDSSVYAFLKGQQSLNAQECFPFWVDLVEMYGLANPIFQNKFTVDYVNNPRWRQENNKLVPCTMDRIFVRYSDRLPEIKKGGMFGEEIFSQTELSASDHYGVCLELDDIY